MAEPKAYKTKLSDFKPDPHNLNRHKQRGRGMVENSQRQRGFGRPGFAAKDKTMLGGNLSIMEVAADIELGNGEIFVVETDGDIPIVHLRRDLDPDTEAAKLLAAEDNQSALVSIDFDPEQFAKEIAAGVDFGGIFTEDESSKLLDLSRISYTPNLSPTFSNNAVTPDDIQKEQHRIDEKFNDKSDQIELICPHCHEIYFVNRNSIL